MAAVVEMGEVDDIPSKEDSKGDILVNGSINNDKEAGETKEKMVADEEAADEVMDVDKLTDSGRKDASVTENDSVSDAKTSENTHKSTDGAPEDKPSDGAVGLDTSDSSAQSEQPCPAASSPSGESETKEISDDEVTEVHTIDSDDDEDGDEDDDNDDLPEGNEQDGIDKHDEDDTDDVMIVDDDVKENGTASPEHEHEKESDDCTVIDETTDDVGRDAAKKNEISPRRSSRQQAVQAKRSLPAPAASKVISDESDIEEVMEEDPLAQPEPAKKARKSSTIVVNDTKRLVEIAAKTAPQSSGKKEPTLVIIDTNSILSGRGPVPVTAGAKTTSATTNAFNILPMALPAQGLYPPNMRATITPIPMSNAAKAMPGLTPVLTQAAQAAAAAAAAAAACAATAILPSLTDDMFVVEAPSFIVPYVYEKPPIKEFKEFVGEIAAEIKKDRRPDGDDAVGEKNGAAAADDDDVEEIKDDDSDAGKKDDDKKTYFESPIGKFFIDIGYNLVQEYVQTDLLKQQKRKRDREGGVNHETNKTIQSLIKTLEFTKENNEPYRTATKKCEFCSYKSDSKLAMDFHLETPHMKNFVYRCNFCTYEVRSPHDILFHMEAEHCVRGRLERTPAFHQCPNCPFEDNQKGKLSRHSVACAKKFKPERNLEPPLDWEPPAKIPRQPRMKTPNLAAMYQAMAKSTQAQYLKTATAAAVTLAHQQQQQAQQTAVSRGRGRPSLGMSSKMLKSAQKTLDIMPTVPGGSSVLVPTNFQLAGNQLYQNSTPKSKTVHQPSISITPLPRGSTSSAHNVQGGGAKPGDSNSKNSFVICEICDGYIKDLEQLRNHMQWIHKVKIHPKMIYNRPPLNCQKCQFRFFTDQGLERHLLGSHGLVTSSMQEAANKCKDSGRCPVCGRVYQWKLLNHVARDHNMTLKPAHLSYKCTVCTATFGMYKQFENHVYSAHSVVAKRSIDKKNSGSASAASKSESLLKPLKINDEITIIPQMPKSNGAGSSKDAASRGGSAPGTSRIATPAAECDATPSKS